MYRICLILIIIGILYLISIPKEEYSNYYKKNSDLDYLSSRGKIPKKNKKKLYKNPLAPISKRKRAEKIIIPDIIPSSRVPDDLSDSNNYVIPTPNFDDLIDSPIKLGGRKAKQPKPNRDMIKKKKKKILDKSGKNMDTCVFVESLNKDRVVCPKNYSVYTGASIGSKNGILSCNGKESAIKGATAIAVIKKGKVAMISVTNRGDNYTKSPNVKIIGDGEGAKAYVVLKNKKVSKIILKNGGKNYNSTPTVKIAKPNLTTYCNLCCRNEL